MLCWKGMDYFSNIARCYWSAMYDSWSEVLQNINPPVLQDFRLDVDGVLSEYMDKAYAVISDSLAELG